MSCVICVSCSCTSLHSISGGTPEATFCHHPRIGNRPWPFWLSVSMCNRLKAKLLSLQAGCASQPCLNGVSLCIRRPVVAWVPSRTRHEASSDSAACSILGQCRLPWRSLLTPSWALTWRGGCWTDSSAWSENLMEFSCSCLSGKVPCFEAWFGFVLLTLFKNDLIKQNK